MQGSGYLQMTRTLGIVTALKIMNVALQKTLLQNLYYTPKNPNGKRK